MRVEGNVSTRSPFSGELRRASENSVDTGRYEIVGKENELWIKDKETATWVKLWGDPHGVTSDGDKFQFHEDNLTFMLKDGTKLTVRPSEKNASGLAYLESVGISKGNEGFIIDGLSDGKKGVQVSDKTLGAHVDALYDDGTVLLAGEQVDDLFWGEHFANEIVGTDASQRFDEHMMDGLGFDRETMDLVERLYADFFPGEHEIQWGNSESVLEVLADILSKLKGKRDEKLQDMKKFAGDDEMERDFTVAQMEFQMYNNQFNTIQTAMTNYVAAKGQTEQAIAQNIR